MIDEQEIASRAVPGLMQAFEAGGMMELEQSGGAALAALFREHGAPGFLVPREAGGSGGSLVDLAHVLRYVGSRCPSLAVMMTMHHHSVGGFARANTIPIRGGGALLQRVARERALVASAFSEGRPGTDILDSTVACTRVDAGFALSGVKKPCCMTHTADVAVVGVAAQLEDGGRSRGIALVDMASNGISRSRFWPAEILASTDSHAVTFDGVPVGDDCLLAPRDGGRAATKERLAVAYAEMALSCLFQVMVCATYLGMATRLCELVLRRRGGSASQRVELLSQVETAAMAVYLLAQKVDKGDFSGHLLGQCVLVTHNTAAQIERVIAGCAKALGGSGYLGSPEARYLVLAGRCLDFHPPSTAVAEQIVDNCYTDLVG